MARITPFIPEETRRLSGQATVPAVEFRNVTKRFALGSRPEEALTALDGVNLVIQRGEFVCVLGPSGHGKSTMLNLLAGFIKPSEGEVLHAGRPVTGPGPERGVVFQRDTLFLWKRVSDNITFGLRARGVPRRERDAIAAHYLKLIELERFAQAWPRQLSGGMRRRVAIAAVFANRPDVLLMDEPFTGLDYVRRERLYRVLENLWREVGSTVFFITHDVDEALTLADRIVIVVRGKVVHETSVPFPRPRSPELIAGPDAVGYRLELLHQLGQAFTETAEPGPPAV
ncbi:MAG TPA: ABC transporter ATP-binding protein [Chthoniobacterales bacterium]